MPFAYAGTRRRRNRDRRRSHDAITADTGDRRENPQTPQSGPQSNSGSESNSRPQSNSGPQSNPLAERGKQEERGHAPPGVDEQDLHDPGSRDPDAPPVDNRS